MTGPNPTDRNKSGTKRHVLTDQSGIPLSVAITPANTHDMKAAKETRDSMIIQRSPDKHNLCLDKGYDFLEIEREPIRRRRHISHISVKEEEIKNW